MKMHKSITQDRIIAAVERSMHSLDNPGLCVACGADAEGVEPDARKYECECCGKRAVYGAEELLFMVA
jgi:predicted amidophosphoribosyltransferase